MVFAGRRNRETTPLNCTTALSELSRLRCSAKTIEISLQNWALKLKNNENKEAWGRTILHDYYTRKDLSIEYKFISQWIYQFRSVPRK